MTPSRLASPFSPKAGAASPSASGVVKDTPLNINSRRSFASGFRKPPPKPKHMDSQIDFEPIVSEDPTMDSQVLTEHQKEVKERQSETATLFSNVGVTRAGKGKKPVPRFVDEGPSSTDASSVGLGGDGQKDSSDDVLVDEMEVSRVEETQPETGANETASFISGMSNGDSNPQLLPTKADESEESSFVPSSEEVGEQSFEIASPSKEDWEDEDVEMDDTPADETPEDSDDSNILSDPPSVEEDDFVDAPDHPPSDQDGSVPEKSGKESMGTSASTSSPEISEEASPVSMIPSSTQSDEDKEVSNASGHSSPDAQIIDEERASHGLPATPKSVRVKKGKRGSVLAGLSISPDILDTIIISGDGPAAPSPYRTRSARLAQDKTAEKAAGRSVETTPSKGTKSSKLAQENVAEKAGERLTEGTPSKGFKAAKQAQGKAVQQRETTPSKSSKAAKQAQENVVQKGEATPSRASKSAKQVQRTPVEKKPGEATPSKSKSPRQSSKFSPPRTRSSAKKGVAGTPRIAALSEPGLFPL